MLNPFHPFGLAKRLRRMPCSLVHEDHFLRIHEAEKAGLIKVSIKDEVRALCRLGVAGTDPVPSLSRLIMTKVTIGGEGRDFSAWVPGL